MLDTSKIIIEDDGVRYADHNKYWERFDLHEELIKKNVELLLSYGVLLSISDLLQSLAFLSKICIHALIRSLAL